MPNPAKPPGLCPPARHGRLPAREPLPCWRPTQGNPSKLLTGISRATASAWYCKTQTRPRKLARGMPCPWPTEQGWAGQAVGAIPVVQTGSTRDRALDTGPGHPRLSFTAPKGHLAPRSPPALAHPSRWASFFSRSWMTSSSTRMVCWLVSSTPSSDCSWDCRSPCALAGPCP